MKASLNRKEFGIWHTENGTRVKGANKNVNYTERDNSYYIIDKDDLYGCVDMLFGCLDYLYGCVDGLYGEVDGRLYGRACNLRGDITGIFGCIDGIYGNLDACEISYKDREKGIDIETLVFKSKKEASEKWRVK